MSGVGEWGRRGGLRWGSEGVVWGSGGGEEG